MRYKTMNIECSQNRANGNHIEGIASSNQNIVLNLAPATAIFGKGKKIAILDSNPIFATLLPLFTNIQADQQGVKRLLPTNPDGSVNPAFPQELAFIDGGVDITVNFPAGVLYERVYTSNVLDANNNPVHRIGETVCDASGQPILYNSVSVFTVRIPDPDSPTGFSYPLGSPEDLANRYLRNGYRRVSVEQQVIQQGDSASITFDPGQTQAPTQGVVPPAGTVPPASNVPPIPPVI